MLYLFYYQAINLSTRTRMQSSNIGGARINMKFKDAQMLNNKGDEQR